MQLTEREEKIYSDGQLLGAKNAQEQLENLMTKVYGQGGIEERMILAEACAKDLHMMLSRIVHSGLNEKRKSQAGNLLKHAGGMIGLPRVGIREGAEKEDG